MQYILSKKKLHLYRIDSVGLFRKCEHDPNSSMNVEFSSVWPPLVLRFDEIVFQNIHRCNQKSSIQVLGTVEVLVLEKIGRYPTLFK